MRANVVKEKSFDFAVKIVRLCQSLQQRREGRAIYEQLFKSGTSIGANIHEAQESQSKKDFIAKLQISIKEAAETEYWLKLMYHTDYINNQVYEDLNKDCKELLKLLTAIIKSSKVAE